MSNYNLHPELKKLSKAKSSFSRAGLISTNATLRLSFHRKQKGIRVQKLRVPGFAGKKLKAWVYAPKYLTNTAPCMVYFHGGAFATRTTPHHHSLAQIYALETGCKVVLVEYRLAPKYPFPIPAEDCFAAYRWVCDHAQALGIRKERIAVGGDSAGGALAAACCQMARDRGIRMPCLQLLIYPVTDRRMRTASMAAFPDTPMWNAESNAVMWQLYLPENADAPIAYASPMEADSLASLPNAYVETAEFDCLRDEAAAYAVALHKAGVCVEVNMTKGTVHGFDTMLKSQLVQTCIDRRCLALKRAFQTP